MKVSHIPLVALGAVILIIVVAATWPRSCPQGRVHFEEVCVKEDVVDYAACVRIRGASIKSADKGKAFQAALHSQLKSKGTAATVVDIRNALLVQYNPLPDAQLEQQIINHCFELAVPRPVIQPAVFEVERDAAVTGPDAGATQRDAGVTRRGTGASVRAGKCTWSLAGVLAPAVYSGPNPQKRFACGELPKGAAYSVSIEGRVTYQGFCPPHKYSATSGPQRSFWYYMWLNGQPTERVDRTEDGGSAFKLDAQARVDERGEVQAILELKNNDNTGMDKICDLVLDGKLTIASDPNYKTGNTGRRE